MHYVKSFFLLFLILNLTFCSGGQSEEQNLSQNNNPITEQNCQKNLSISLEGGGLNNTTNTSCENDNSEPETLSSEQITVPQLLIGMSQNTEEIIREKAKKYGITHLSDPEINANLIKFIVAIDQKGQEDHVYDLVEIWNTKMWPYSLSSQYTKEWPVNKFTNLILNNANIRISSFLKQAFNKEIENYEAMGTSDASSYELYESIFVSDDINKNIGSNLFLAAGMILYGPHVSFEVEGQCKSFFKMNEDPNQNDDKIGVWTWIDCKDNALRNYMKN